MNAASEQISGSSIGNPYINPYDGIAIVSPFYNISRIYTINKVVHKFDSNGYITEFDAVYIMFDTDGKVMDTDSKVKEVYEKLINSKSASTESSGEIDSSIEGLQTADEPMGEIDGTEQP